MMEVLQIKFLTPTCFCNIEDENVKKLYVARLVKKLMSKTFDKKWNTQTAQTLVDLVTQIYGREAQRKNEEEEKVKEAELQIQNLQMQYIIVIARNVTDNATEFENVAWVWTCQSSSHLVGYGSDLFEAVELGADAVKKGRFSLMHFISFMLCTSQENKARLR
jgi:hypothetical protein